MSKKGKMPNFSKMLKENAKKITIMVKDEEKPLSTLISDSVDGVVATSIDGIIPVTAQEAAEDRRFDEYDDNIDDCVVEKPKSDSVSEDLQSALAAKAAEERVARHPDESKPAKSPDEQQDAVFSSAEAATTKVPTTDGKTSPVDD